MRKPVPLSYGLKNHNKSVDIISPYGIFIGHFDL